jgi:hypothetical protein
LGERGKNWNPFGAPINKSNEKLNFEGIKVPFEKGGFKGISGGYLKSR